MLIKEIQLKNKFKVGSFTRDMTAASGTQAITGIGFKPSVLYVFGIELVNNGLSFGVSDGTTDQRISTRHDYSGTELLMYCTADAATYQKAALTSFDGDGFTVTWTKGGTPGAGTATNIYLAIR